jgi:hypothetical protein
MAKRPRGSQCADALGISLHKLRAPAPRVLTCDCNQCYGTGNQLSESQRKVHRSRHGVHRQPPLIDAAVPFVHGKRVHHLIEDEDYGGGGGDDGESTRSAHVNSCARWDCAASSRSVLTPPYYARIVDAIDDVLCADDASPAVELAVDVDAGESTLRARTTSVSTRLRARLPRNTVLTFITAMRRHAC